MYTQNKQQEIQNIFQNTIIFIQEQIQSSNQYVETKCQNQSIMCRVNVLIRKRSSPDR